MGNDWRHGQVSGVHKFNKGLADMILEIGTKYITRCGNVVEIDRMELADDPEGKPRRIYYARAVKTINGHESLLRKRQIYSETGKWLNEYRQIQPKCIHDLKELYK